MKHRRETDAGAPEDAGPRRRMDRCGRPRLPRCSGASDRANPPSRQPRPGPPGGRPDHPRALRRARRPHEHPPRRGARGRHLLLVPPGSDERPRLHRPGLRLPGGAELLARRARSRCRASATATSRRSPTNGDTILPPAVTHSTNHGPALDLGTEGRSPTTRPRRSRALRDLPRGAHRRGARGLRPLRLRRRRLPDRAQVGVPPPRARAARPRRERRRGRAGNDQGPLRHGAPAAPAARGDR